MTTFLLSFLPRELYIRVFALDGNFKADHMIPKNEDNVHLMDREVFMTAQGPYQEHLKDATERAPHYKRVS